MNEHLLHSMDDAWEHITRLLFCEKTNLIYDYLGSLDDHRFDFLPYPEEIRQDFPNPRGYSTGMEDSMINNGMMTAAALLRASLFPEYHDECRHFAAKLLQGMELCATVHGRNGYIVRSVSHRDGKSCYSCSSRDQMTFWVWGLWRYFHSPFATKTEQQKIRELSVMLASRGEKEIRAENNYSYLTLGGVPDILNQMDEVKPHEILRLPMFYLAAWKLSGDPHWHDLFEGIIERCLKCAAEDKSYWNHFELSQFLLTLAFLHEAEPRPEYSVIAGKIGDIAEKQLCEKFLPQLEQWQGTWSIPATAWRDSTALRLNRQSDGSVVANGRIDLRCEQTPGFHELMDLMRIPGNLMMGVLLAPERCVSADLISRFLAAFELPDYRVCTSCASVNLLYAALLALKNFREQC
ncbi:MAG: hypothetical protein IJW17_12965 [Lentisphaeria bacterium]|nr:hypothetical protein [Lentisphaeria bacterium]